MAIFCTECGEKLEDSALFCTGCGQKVERDAGAGAPPPATKPAEPPKQQAKEAPAKQEAQEPPMEQPPTQEPAMGVPLPGAAPMVSVPPGVAKQGNSKLMLWMGALVVLILVTAGLAYVAFQQFVHGGGDVAVEEQPLATEDGETSSGDDVAAPAFGDSDPSSTAAGPLDAPVESVEPVDSPEPAKPSEPVRQAKVAPPPGPRRSAPAPRPKVSEPTPKPLPTPKPEPEPLPATAPEPAEVPAAAVPPPPPPAPAPEPEPASPPPAPKGSKVMLSGSDAYTPPAPEPSAPKSAAPGRSAAPPAVPSSGDIFWSGTLDKNEIVTVDFAAGAGGVGGDSLPGKPVRLETFSPVVEITELPGPENGWKRFSFKATRNAKKSVTLNFHWSLAE